MKRTVYLILFRGVGGKTQLPVQTLHEKLTAAGFENVATYINSGNAIVRSRLSRKQVVATIAELCRTQFAFDKAIFAPTLAEWDEVIARNPFAKAVTNAPTTVHAALLASTPKAEDVERIRALAVKGENIKVIENVAYLHTPEAKELYTDVGFLRSTDIKEAKKGGGQFPAIEDLFTVDEIGGWDALNEELFSDNGIATQAIAAG